MPDDSTTKKGTISVALKILISGLLLIPDDNMCKNIPYFITTMNIMER